MVDESEQVRRLRLSNMADQFGLETLGEGFETIGEQAMLAQLGCDYIQGFGLERPMPYEKTALWMDQHLEKIGPQVQIGMRRS